MKIRRLTFIVIVLALLLHPLPVAAQTRVSITMLDRNNQSITSLVDGNRISLRAELDRPADADTAVDFLLDGVDTPVGTCHIASGARACQTGPFPALGWFWGADGRAQPQRGIHAQMNGQQTEAGLSVAIHPRPVVLVHGFNADWHTWDNYLGPQGYLASIGLHGYAVGDGQVPGVMNTGSLSNPTARTNTIAQNAVILSQYIDGVQKATGAERVDLVVHSMGGMIARYYLDRVMTGENVAQLIILGTPEAGSDCADLPASLGLLLPATLEIQPSYMVDIFNRQIYHRRGVPFYALAGTKLSDAVQSPCTPVPSDLVVTIDSVKAIPMPVQEISLLHMDLNTAREVFDEFVKPHLQTPSGKFESPADPPPGSAPAVSTQFTRVYTGHLDAGQTQAVVINIDPNVTVANFALFDTSRTLDISVTGASGNTLQLDAVKNGLIRVDDPSIMVYLGYGFENPKPGKWVVTLHTTTATPASGADYAITAQFNGGAKLTASADPILPALNQPVSIHTDLTANGAALPIVTAQARLTKPDGGVETSPMTIQNNSAQLQVKPDQTGIYGAEISVTSLTSDGFAVDRAVFLAFEVQPSGQAAVSRQSVFWLLLIVIVLGLIFIVVMLILAVVFFRRRRR